MISCYYLFILLSFFLINTIFLQLNSCYHAFRLSPTRGLHGCKHLFISRLSDENKSETKISSTKVSTYLKTKKSSNSSNVISHPKKIEEGWFLELSNSVMLKIPFKTNNPLRKDQLKKFKPSSMFSSINRVDGRKKWMNEINQYNNSMQNVSVPLLCALSKELLYSGSPEQSVELLLSFIGLFGHIESYEFFRLNVLTVRALIRLGKLSEAISLLKFCYSRYQGDKEETTSDSIPFFDTNSTLHRKILNRKDTDIIRDLSEAIAELAVSSKKGLQEALALRKAMILRGHAPLLGIGSAGLLKGLRLHFLERRSTLSGTQSSSPLMQNILGISNSKINTTTLELTLTHEEVETLAHQIAAPHLSKFSSTPEVQTNNTRRAQRVCMI
jgi:hypothetical protein